MAAARPDLDGMVASAGGKSPASECERVSTAFEWKDVAAVVPAHDLPGKGVYALRVREMGTPAGVIDERLQQVLAAVA